MINNRTFTENETIGIPNPMYLKIQHINLLSEDFLLPITLLVSWICITLCISTWGNSAELGKISKVSDLWRLLDVRCTLPTSKTLDMKISFLHPHGPSPFSYFVNSWIRRVKRNVKVRNSKLTDAKNIPTTEIPENCLKKTTNSFRVHWHTHS